MDEYCNIGYMENMADALNSIRGFNMSCQIVVQSLSQWQEKYPGKEWENQLATFDQTLYMGCNDLTSAKYISEKRGKITIAVTNNQMPLAPLFSPVYSTTRPYSQTKSNIQRDLMLPDEVMRLDRDKCIALFQGHKPALLYKIVPEDLPFYSSPRSRRIIDYTPEWKRRETAGAAASPTPSDPTTPTSSQTRNVSAGSGKTESVGKPGAPPRCSEYDYDFSGIKSVCHDSEMKAASDSDVIGFDDEDEDDLCP